jgi:hypothetical protein
MLPTTLIMKKLALATSVVAVTALLGATLLLRGQDKPAAARYEYAILKWDGPDRLYYNLPDKFEMVHLEKLGKAIPKEAQDEEWCLALGCNIMAKDGWEPVNLNSRRVLMRRPVLR